MSSNAITSKPKSKFYNYTKNGGTGNDLFDLRTIDYLYPKLVVRAFLDGKGGTDTLLISPTLADFSASKQADGSISIRAKNCTFNTKNVEYLEIDDLNRTTLNLKYSLTGDGDITGTAGADKLGVIFSGAEMTGGKGKDLFYVDNITSLISSNGIYSATITDFNRKEGDKIVVDAAYRNSDRLPEWLKIAADSSGVINLNFGEDANVTVKGLTAGQTLQRSDFAFA